MADYRYIPRDLLVYPSQFGRDEHAEWDSQKMAGVHRSIVAAAYFQHVAACLVYQRATPEPGRIERLAERLDVNPDTLRRKLFGESPARLDEVLEWAIEFGADILPPVAATEDLFPKQM